MSTSSRCSSLSLSLLVFYLVQLALAVPLPASAPAPLLKSSKSSTSTKPKKGGIVLPFGRQRREVKRADQNGDILGGEVGLGDNSDLFYTVAVTVGDSTTAVNLDTGSSDLWVMSSSCKTTQCQRSTAAPYDQKSFKSLGSTVQLQYGDSTSGTHASGPVGTDTVTLAALTMPNQPLAAIDDTDNSAVSNGGAGILGLGFPAQSFVQASAINAVFSSPSGTDTFISQAAAYGPIVSRLIEADMIDDPLFSITLQRDTIDISGQGQITIGQLPDEIDESNITWVPVRLYAPSEGGLSPPTFAPSEVYPLRWEVPIDAVFLDGQKLATSTQTGAGLNSSEISALIDTGNSLIRGPQDVVNNIMSSVSPSFVANSNAQPILPCAKPHTLAFQIGGKMFPVDPRDFTSQNKKGDTTNCVANNVVGTDAPSTGALFSWNLGDPFLKSNMVIFYYGNLTHPSVDPPRIGFVSLVPDNVDQLYTQAINDAQKDGAFESKADAAPTSSALITEGAPSTTTANSVASISASNPTNSPGATTITSTASATTPTETKKDSAAASLCVPRVGAWSSVVLAMLSLLLSSLCIL